MKYSIGIDIGGTHTDAVLVDSQNKIVAATKTETTPSLEQGVKTVIAELLQQVDSSAITGIFVGTTHATNAILERRDLFRVGLIRIAGHRPESLRPCFEWTKEMRDTVLVGYETVDGGFECDGRSITPFCQKQAAEAAERLIAKGAESIAIVGVFSPISGDQEKECAEAIVNIPISLSHEIGGVGFIERENATILNAALKQPMEKGFRNLEKARDALGLSCPLYVTQNDGSLIDLQQAIAYPLLTVSAGPTNSFIGACQLAKVKDAIVIDIGGTSTDIGLIRNGYPQRSISNAQIGGVSLNFRMPDVLALALGGGSYIQEKKIGPRSAGSRLMQEAKVFGGASLTMTDVAYKAGCLDLPQGNFDRIGISQSFTHEVMQKATEMIQSGICVMRGNRKDLPVIVVGGGAGIASYDGTEVVIPDFAAVANAYGAALAEVAATVETVVSLEDREKTLDRLKQQALQEALQKGAKDPRVVDLKVVPYHYMPNQLARVIVTASGVWAKPFGVR